MVEGTSFIPMTAMTIIIDGHSIPFSGVAAESHAKIHPSTNIIKLLNKANKLKPNIEEIRRRSGGQKSQRPKER